MTDVIRHISGAQRQVLATCRTARIVLEHAPCALPAAMAVVEAAEGVVEATAAKFEAADRVDRYGPGGGLPRLLSEAAKASAAAWDELTSALHRAQHEEGPAATIAQDVFSVAALMLASAEDGTAQVLDAQRRIVRIGARLAPAGEAQCVVEACIAEWRAADEPNLSMGGRAAAPVAAAEVVGGGDAGS